MKDNKAARYKRGLTIINLIQTNAGYSIIQGTELLNKVNNQTSTSTSGALGNPSSSHQASIPVFKQPIKMAVKHNNLVFLKSGRRLNEEVQENGGKNIEQKLIYEQKLPYNQWFNFDQISELQKNEVKSWITQWNSTKPINQFILNSYLQKYKHHRNIIIEIYYKNFAPHQSYMSASSVRKYICQDAKWLMKIHLFLTTWAIINSNQINFDNQNFLISNIFKLTQQGKYDVLDLQSSFYSKYGRNSLKECENDNFLKLKKVTKGIRPYCDYCGIHCQIVWFQHIRAIDPKQISTIMKNVNSKNPPLSQKQYEIILCTKCYCNGNFPLLLTHHDFRKISVNDRLQPVKKKKINKNKRKQKKRKLKQKQSLLQQQQQFKQQVQEPEEQYLNKTDKQQKQTKTDKQMHKQTKVDKQMHKQIQKQKQQQNQNSKQSGNDKDRKHSAINLNGTKQIKQNKIQNENPQTLTQAQKQANVNQIIQQIVKSIKNQRVWTLQQTYKMLQYVNKYQDDWDTIYKNMNDIGLCKDCQPQDLILHFIRLPQMNISELIEQNTDQSFVNQNKNQYKSDYLTKKIQRNYDNCVKLSIILKQTENKLKKQKNENWKQLLNKFVTLNITKIKTKIELLNEINIKSLRQHKNYERAYKDIVDL